MKGNEIAQTFFRTMRALIRELNYHRGQRATYSDLFNNSLGADPFSTLTPLQQLYQIQTEYHATMAAEIDKAMHNYCSAVDLSCPMDAFQ